MLNRPAMGSIALGLALAASGCAGQAPRPVAPPAAAARSYDGTYTGTLRVTGASSGMSRRDCATEPRFSVNVAGNRFSFPLPHPAAAEATPSLRDSATPVYNASIAPDGTIKGFSDDTNTAVEGRVVGAHMSGEVYGLLCYYAFTADRN